MLEMMKMELLEPGGPNSSDFSTVSGTDLGHKKNHPTVPPGVPLSGGTVEGDFPLSNSSPLQHSYSAQGGVHKVQPAF